MIAIQSESNFNSHQIGMFVFLYSISYHSYGMKKVKFYRNLTIVAVCVNFHIENI